MRPGWLLLAPRLVVLLAIAAPAFPGDVERAQELIESVGTDDPRAGELLDLARKPAVRKWLRSRIRELWKDEENRDRVEPYFLLLARTGAGREEVQFLVDGASQETEDYSYVSRYAEVLLERAPTALDVEPLLDLIARRAASVLYDGAAANSIWLLAHRLPRDRVERAIETAWKKATPLERRKKPEWGYLELTILGPDGKPPEDILWIRDMGAWNPSQLVVWPDGKARCGNYFRNGEKAWEAEITVTLPGFKESEKTKLTFEKGEVHRAEIRLGEPRAWVRGRIVPPPTTPLFARLHSGVTVGHALDPYRHQRGELSIPVRSDGSFQAPSNSRGKALLILDVDGNVFHAQPVEVPEGSDGVDLGEVKLPGRRDLVDVPIHVVWPADLPRGEEFQGNVNWASQDPNVPRGRTNFSAGTGKKTGKVFVGLARNVPPGQYTVTAEFSRSKNQGEVAPIVMEVTVKGEKDALVLEPRKGKAAPAPTAEAPTGAGVPVAHGYGFVLRRSPSGQVHLLSSDSRGVVHAAREGESFGAERVLFKAPARRKDEDSAWTISVDFVPDRDGSLHVFRVADRTEDCKALYYARAPKSGSQQPRWVPLADSPSPADDYGEPMVIAKKNGSLEVFAPVMRLLKESESSFTVESTRLFRGVIQGGRLRALPAVQLDTGNPFTPLQAKVVGSPGGEAHVLFVRKGASLAWKDLASMAEGTAGDVPDASRFDNAGIVASPRGEVHLALPLQGQGEKHPRFWIGAARIGERFTARGIIEGPFPSGQEPYLALTPAGKAYLVASLRPPEKDDGQVALWDLSGDFPPKPILTPWLDSSTAGPQAVFIDERNAVVAWDRDGAIHAETFALPEG